MARHREWMKAKAKVKADAKARARVKAKTDALTLRNQQASPLLRLPGEIRNMIYAFVIHGVVAQEVDAKSTQFSSQTCSPPAANRKFKHNKEPARFLGLLSVSRQVYAETYLLPFKLNDFQSRRIQDMGDLLGEFSEGQQNAIVTLRFSSLAVTRRCYCNCYGTWGRHSRQLIQETFADLPAMLGLKRVVVEDHRSLGKAARRDLTDIINAGLGSRVVEVTFE